MRRLVYWGALLAFGVVFFFFVLADNGFERCAAAAPRLESRYGGLSYFPPGYECLYTTRPNKLVALDQRGWMNWALAIGTGLLLLYGSLSFSVRMGLRVSARRTPPAPTG